MSDARKFLDDIHRTVALLEAMERGHEETAELYDKLKLADALELQAERFRLLLEIDECCGCGGTEIVPTNHDSRDPAYGERCGHCNKLFSEIDHKGKQVKQAWEDAA